MRVWMIAGLACVLVPAAAAGTAGGLIASKEPGWPQWRGPRRDGVSDEKGLLQTWPAGGPKALWTARGLGRGYSSAIITRGRIYITGDVGGELHVFALDLDGKRKWQATNGRGYRRSTPGARASCTYADGRVYNMNGHGRVACFDAATGRERWAVNILERFEARPNIWGLAESVLVDGDRVFATPCGDKGAMAALDTNTGATLWASQPVTGDTAGYSSAILFEFGGRRHLVNSSSAHLLSVDADSGKLLWTQPRPTERGVNCASPIYHDGAVFASSPNGMGAALYRVRLDDGNVSAERAWTSPLENALGGVVLVDGSVYGSGTDGGRTWACVDIQSGATRYTAYPIWPGAVIYADGRLYCLSTRGEMALLAPTPQGFQVAGRFRFVSRRQDVWARPAICDGRLYLQYHDTLYCYDIRATRSPQPGRTPWFEENRP